MIEVEDFSPPEQVVGSITWCPAECAHEPAGLIYECGGLVVWTRKGYKRPEPGFTP